MDSLARIPPAEPLLIGRVLDGSGGAHAVTWDTVRTAPPRDGEVMWLHLDRTAPGVEEWLLGLPGMTEPTAELLTSDNTRPRALREGQALVATLRGINANPGAEPEDMISLQIWCDGHLLVTLRRDPVQATRRIAALLDAGDGPKDAGDTITMIAELLVGRTSDAVADMNTALDALEDDIAAATPEQAMGDIAAIRRNCLKLKRHMGPQHEAFEQIAHDAPAWFEDHDRREMAESIARLRRYLDDIDVTQESAMVLQDELRARSEAKSQRATYKLTILAGVFLPLTFLTGLLGINVAGIPGAEHPLAFWAVVAICAGIFLLSLAVLRRLRWL